MSRRIPGSERTREGLRDLIEGRLSSQAGRSELVRLATRLIIEDGLEAEVRDTLGRDYYEHGQVAGQGYGNGVREGRLKTAEGFIGYSATKVAGPAEPFGSELRGHLKGDSEALEDLAVEMLARGLSVRDIEDAFKDGTGRLCCPGRRTLSEQMALNAGCPSSKQMGLLSVFHKGGSGSSSFDVKPLGVDGSSGGFGWSVF